MSKIESWVERKFRFDYPVERYPNVVMRLRGTPPRLEDITRGLPVDTLTRRPQGKWSIQENAGHLVALEPLLMTRVEEYLAGAAELTGADMSNAATDAANLNQQDLEQILGEFRERRMQLVSRLDALESREFARTSVHPRLSLTMRLVDLLCFHAEHDDHHLARIWEMSRGSG